MFCIECGKQIPDCSTVCPECGQVLKITKITPSYRSTIKGFFGLLFSFISMPIKTLKLTVNELKELGNQGKLDVDSTNIPHLTWLGIAGRMIISIIIIGTVIFGFASGINYLTQIRRSMGNAIGGLIGSIIGGLFLAIFLDWLFSLSLEMMQIFVNISNDIKKLSNK
ncbi:MAG: zinc ribbon domain-containing protein [Candidatus Schekmanbacteria bacterium]|nr:MAG: zinc ribbon domain-containing protein [Candidatus Schekmanbacteria bacterium]